MRTVSFVLHSDMRICGCLNFILLTTISLISGTFKFYFVDNDGKKIEIETLEDFPGSNIKKIVVDFGFTFYLANVVGAIGGGNGTTYYINGSMPILKRCPLFDGFRCERVARLFILEGNDLQRKYEFDGYYTNTDSYVGCYKTNITPITAVESSMGNCIERCTNQATPIYAMSKRNCICLRDTSELLPAKLETCRSPCAARIFRFCGDDNHYSLYSLRSWGKDPNVYEPSWECIFENRSCPICPAGRKGLSCEIIDCSENNGNCGDLDCQTMTYSGYMTVAVCICKQGYYFDDRINCQDVNECLKNPCSSDMRCVNTDGSYGCDCAAGYEKIENICIDVDECRSVESCDGGSSICKNLIGGYECHCRIGYVRQESDSLNRRCQDIDECSSITTCDQDSTYCHNFDGDYECLCKEGYIRMISKSHKSNCNDEDECLQRDKCPHGIQCLNSIGSYDCKCPRGTKKVTYKHIVECEEIDECLMPEICDASNSFCLNTFEGYICACRTGYVPVDNFTCVIKGKGNMTTEEYGLTTAVYDDYYPESTFEEYYAYAFILFVVVVVGAIFITILCKTKNLPPSNVTSLTSVSSSL